MIKHTSQWLLCACFEIYSFPKLSSVLGIDTRSFSILIVDLTILGFQARHRLRKIKEK